MNMMRPLFLWIAAVLALTAPAEAQKRGPLVLAAASLQESMNAAADAWAAAGRARPVISFAASSALARQIEAGAPADLFVSADVEWMDVLQREQLIRPGSRSDFLGNRLALIAPAGSRVALRIARGFPIARALGDGRLAMADPAAVPAGRYGKAALTALGVWPSVANRVAHAENVRAALALVERGATPLGIVYETDARASAKVRVVGLFPSGSHAPITYPTAIIASSRNPEAEGFRRFLLSPRGRAIFQRYGFSVR